MKNKKSPGLFSSPETAKNKGHLDKLFLQKARLLYAGTVIVTVVLGLGSRMFSAQLPDFVSLHFGDALWAAMVYFGFRTLFTAKSLALTALAGLLFSFAIEFSQLYQADWINGIRETLPGALILGKGFLAIDLVRYTAGIVGAFLLDYFLFCHSFLPSNAKKVFG